MSPFTPDVLMRRMIVCRLQPNLSGSLMSSSLRVSPFEAFDSSSVSLSLGLTSRCAASRACEAALDACLPLEELPLALAGGKMSWPVDEIVGQPGCSCVGKPPAAKRFEIICKL